MNYFRLIISALLFSSLPLLPLHAQEASPAAGVSTAVPVFLNTTTCTKKSEKKPNNYWKERFKPYGLNYGIWQVSSGDDQSMEVQYSFKYIFYDCRRYDKDGNWGCSDDAKTKANAYFSYTGKFDFYMFTRNSSPVINRTSNPAGHINIDHKLNDDFSFWGDLAVEHRSNGQVEDVTKKDTTPGSATFGQYQTEIECQKGNHEYFDGISRDANYVNLETGLKYVDSKIDVGLKLYFTDEGEVTWGRYAGSNSKFKDFDLVRLRASQAFKARCTFFPEVTLGLEYLIGRKALSTDSLDVYLLFPLNLSDLEIPFFAKAHFGPMERLSDYTSSITSYGFGIVFFF